MLSTQQFTIGATTFFGCGALGRLAQIVIRLRAERALLVTDQGLAAAGISGKVERILGTAGVATTTFDGVRANPTTEDLAGGAQAARELGRGVVVAVGGGSVLDVAKGIALMATNEGSARDFDYRHEPARPGLPVIAIPTTAGTGSETNGFGVIEDPEGGRKFYVGHESVSPTAVILDPQLTCGPPARQTAATGMDALTHALESLSSKRHNPYADALNLQVVTMVARYLPRAVADGQDLEARSQLLLAAQMTGLAFSTTGLGLAHAVAHGLSARMGAVHGVALAVLLPHVLSFNLPVRTEAYARVSWALGVSGPEGDDQADAEGAVDAVRRLAQDVGMPGTLQELGCAEAMFPALIEAALADEVMENTPRLPNADELRAVLRAAF